MKLRRVSSITFLHGYFSIHNRRYAFQLEFSILKIRKCQHWQVCCKKCIGNIGIWQLHARILLNIHQIITFIYEQTYVAWPKTRERGKQVRSPYLGCLAQHQPFLVSISLLHDRVTDSNKHNGLDLIMQPNRIKL